MVQQVASEAYQAFAYAYDKALGERFFGAIRRLLDAAIESYPTSDYTHLDVACGTGLAVEYFERRGWSSIGVDASVAMLEIARLRGKRAVAGDFRAIPLRSRFARITCLYDSLNHMLDRNDLVAAFRSVRSVLEDDGLFIFDMNHPEIYPAVWGLADPFVSSASDYRLEIATSFNARNRIGTAVVTGWAKRGGRRITIGEEHLQRAYSESEIIEALGEASMEPVEIVDFDPYDESAQGPTVKLFFVCRVVG